MEVPGFSERTPDDLKAIIDGLIEDEIGFTPMTKLSINYYRRYASQIFDLPGDMNIIFQKPISILKEYFDKNLDGVDIPDREVNLLKHNIVFEVLKYKHGLDKGNYLLTQMERYKIFTRNLEH